MLSESFSQSYCFPSLIHYFLFAGNLPHILGPRVSFHCQGDWFCVQLGVHQDVGVWVGDRRLVWKVPVRNWDRSIGACFPESLEVYFFSHCTKGTKIHKFFFFAEETEARFFSSFSLSLMMMVLMIKMMMAMFTNRKIFSSSMCNNRPYQHLLCYLISEDKIWRRVAL